MLGILLAARCAENAEIKEEWLYRRWVHSFEEDTPQYWVYRPDDYEFPPSRGRDGFSITEDGSFVEYRIGPTDRLDTHQGEWERTDNVIRVALDDDKTMEIIVQSLAERELRMAVPK